MIQRLQSLFLLGVVLCMSMTAFLPAWNYTFNGGSITLKMGNLTYSNSESIVLHQVNMMYLLGIAITAGLVALINIFKFNNRKLQLKIAMINSLLIIIYMVLVYIFVPKQAIELLGNDIPDFHFQLGTFFTIPALLFNILARVFIIKDEDLVKSVDRIR